MLNLQGGTRRVTSTPVKTLHGEKVYLVSNSPLVCQVWHTTIHVQKELLL